MIKFPILGAVSRDACRSLRLISLALLLLLATAVGCRSVNGKLRPAWAPSFAESNVLHESSPKNLFVEVNLETGGTAPGATVEVSGPNGYREDRITNADGLAVFSLPSGHFHVSASFIPFETYRGAVRLEEERVVQLRVMLALGKQEPIF